AAHSQRPAATPPRGAVRSRQSPAIPPRGRRAPGVPTRSRQSIRDWFPYSPASLRLLHADWKRTHVDGAAVHHERGACDVGPAETHVLAVAGAWKYRCRTARNGRCERRRCLRFSVPSSLTSPIDRVHRVAAHQLRRELAPGARSIEQFKSRPLTVDEEDRADLILGRRECGNELLQWRLELVEHRRHCGRVGRCAHPPGPLRDRIPYRALTRGTPH